MCEGPTCVTSVAWVLPEENCGTWKRTNRRLTAKPAIFAASSYGYPSHFSTLLLRTKIQFWGFHYTTPGLISIPREFPRQARTEQGPAPQQLSQDER
ncbi:hypothetical protein J6590_095209 [Homalodisca vitripennis]|nr:hypothetical protein J6590_095209 [Homalodisca vitripennis]